MLGGEDARNAYESDNGEEYISDIRTAEAPAENIKEDGNVGDVQDEIGCGENEQDGDKQGFLKIWAWMFRVQIGVKIVC